LDNLVTPNKHTIDFIADSELYCYLWACFLNVILLTVWISFF